MEWPMDLYLNKMIARYGKNYTSGRRRRASDAELPTRGSSAALFPRQQRPREML
jgi:hypothetical protein